MNRKIIFTVLIVSAIFCAAYVQSGIKPKPQMYFIGYSALTTMMLFTKIKVIPEILYNIMIGLMFYLMFFILCMFIIDLISPGRATGYLEDGRQVKFMDYTFVYAVFIGLILSLITVVTYTRSRKKNGLITCEKYIALITFIVTLMGFCIYEL